MKLRYITIIAACMLPSCGKHTPPPIHGTYIDIIDNLAEPDNLPPLPGPILLLFDFKNDPNQSADFSLQLLTGKLHTLKEAAHLNGLSNEKNKDEDEVAQHTQIVRSFCDAVQSSITNFPKEYQATATSDRVELFATICQELEILSNSNLSQRVLLVFGGLDEINPAFSSVSPDGWQLLKDNPDKVVRLLRKRRNLPDNLVGISVLFVCPAAMEQSEHYQALMGMYRSLLRERGARVVFSQNKSFQL